MPASGLSSTEVTSNLGDYLGEAALVTGMLAGYFNLLDKSSFN